MRALAADPAVITGRRGESYNAVAQRGPASECTRQGRCVASQAFEQCKGQAFVSASIKRARLSSPASASTELLACRCRLTSRRSPSPFLNDPEQHEQAHPLQRSTAMQAGSQPVERASELTRNYRARVH